MNTYERAMEILHCLSPLPFNPGYRPGYGKALSEAYAAYCESAEAPKGPGPSEERAAWYAAKAEELKVSFPTWVELEN